jgi:methyl-accepting chemotaxis protein
VDSNEVQSPKYAEFWDVLRSGRFHSGQFRRMGKGGREVWIQASYNPICDANGAPFKVVKYATDITPQIMARIEAEERGATASADIQTVAAATEEMLASVNEISSSMARTQASVSDIINKNAEAKIHTDQLQENTKSMESIVALIRDISEQVNLLALNATIEAARAGDAGKGFAVVAGEVKMLANETAKATDQIAQKISSIQSISNDVVHSGTTIADAVNTVGANTGTIAAAIEEQTATSHEISSKMQSLSIAVDELSQCIQTIAK